MAKVRGKGPDGFKLVWNNPKLNKRGRDGVRYWLEKFKKILHQNLTGGRSGRTYPHPAGGTYVASAPGEYPAERTNKLRESLRVVMKTDSSGTTAAIGTDTKYGGHLERKDPEDGGRPWMTRAWLENREELLRGLIRQFSKTQ